MSKNTNPYRKLNENEPDTREYSFKYKWSLAIEKYGHTDIPNLILLNLPDLRITAAEFLTLTALLSFKWDSKHPWPSTETIAERANTTPRTVRKHTESLEKKGLLKRISRSGQSNVYDLTFLKQKLETLAKSNPHPGQNQPLAPVEIGSEVGLVSTSKEDTVEQDPLINTVVSDDTVEPLPQIRPIYDHFVKQFDKNPSLYRLTPKRKSKIKARLKDAGFEMLMQAIDNTASNGWYCGDNERGWKADLDFITRSYEQVEKLSQLNENELTFKADW